MLDVTYPLFPIFAFLGFILVLVPLPWHLQASNSGTCFFMIWTSLACLNQFVNSVVWAGNALNPAPWWCEISIRIILGASVVIPASSLCIVRRLYKIASVQVVSVSPAEKRRIVLIDSLVCVLFPLIYIALQYVVQGHRFNIFEDIGCYPALYNTLLAYFISLMWPVVIGMISAVYCGLALWEFSKRRLQFSQFLKANTSLTAGRYLRLVALAMTEMCSTTPIAIFVIYLNASTGEVGPWRSWADTHLNYSRVDQIPSIIWRSDRQLEVLMELTRWLAPFCALVFFSFFGFAQEAQRQYRAGYISLAKRFKFLPLPPTKASSKRNFIPCMEMGKAATGLPRYSPQPPSPTAKLEEKVPNTSTSSTFSSDCVSMTDVASKYDTDLLPSPSGAHFIPPTHDLPTIAFPDNHQHINTSDAFPVIFPSDFSSRRFTM